MKRIKKSDIKNLQPLPNQPQYNLYVISRGRAVQSGSFTRWQIYNNWSKETLYECEVTGNIYANTAENNSYSTNGSSTAYLFTPSK